jgi:hypothetical protein
LWHEGHIDTDLLIHLKVVNVGRTHKDRIVISYASLSFLRNARYKVPLCLIFLVISGFSTYSLYSQRNSHWKKALSIVSPDFPVISSCFWRLFLSIFSLFLIKRVAIGSWSGNEFPNPETISVAVLLLLFSIKNLFYLFWSI